LCCKRGGPGKSHRFSILCTWTFAVLQKYTVWVEFSRKIKIPEFQMLPWCSDVNTMSRINPIVSCMIWIMLLMLCVTKTEVTVGENGFSAWLKKRKQSWLSRQQDHGRTLHTTATCVHKNVCKEESSEVWTPKTLFDSPILKKWRKAHLFGWRPGHYT
jgi:hypothetical protein